MMQARSASPVVVVLALGAIVSISGCGKSSDPATPSADDGQAPPTAEPAPPAPSEEPPAPSQAGASGAWTQGEQPAFEAKWSTTGVVTKGETLEGTFHVGPKASRLDVAKHPGAEGPRSFIIVHGESDLWVLDPQAKTVERALSGDWEHDVFPLVIDERKAKRLADGKDDCPLARAGECDKLGAETIAGQAVEGWRRKNRSYWLSPALRVAMRVEYAPFRNNPQTQRAELRDVAPGPQDEALFKVPADYTCDAGSFCESVPR